MATDTQGASGAADKVASTAHNVADAASDTVRSAGDHLSAAVDSVWHNDTVTGIRDKIAEFRHEHPTVAITAAGTIHKRKGAQS